MVLTPWLLMVVLFQPGDQKQFVNGSIQDRECSCGEWLDSVLSSLCPELSLRKDFSMPLQQQFMVTQPGVAMSMITTGHQAEMQGYATFSSEPHSLIKKVKCLWVSCRFSLSGLWKLSGCQHSTLGQEITENYFNDMVGLVLLKWNSVPASLKGIHWNSFHKPFP